MTLNTHSHCVFLHLTLKQGACKLCRRKPPQPNNHSQCVFISKNRDKRSLPQKNYYTKKNKIHFLLQNKIVFCKFAPYNVNSHYINIINN